MKPIVARAVVASHLVHGHAEGLDQPPILHARRAGGLAGSAVETQLQMLANLRAKLQPTVGHCPHQVNSPARTVVLISQLDIGRTRSGAEPAVNAIEKLAVVDVRARD